MLFPTLGARSPGLWRRWLGRVPSQCVVCRSWPTQRVCDDCVARFAAPTPRCQHCALPVPAGVMQCGECIRQGPALDRCLAACDYQWPWTHIIGRMKFHGDPAWAGPLARLMAALPGSQQLLESCDAVVPIPLSAQRLRERGFNQSLELARHLAPGRCAPALLVRTHDTPAQSALSRSQRLRNLRGALRVEPEQAAQLRGQRIVLVDDVMTTGATLSAAAQALRAAGAASVSGWVFARTDWAG